MKKPACHWCGDSTRNMTRICNRCWHDREGIYLERKRWEPESKALSVIKLAALQKARATRRAKRPVDLPVA
jgi:hypothetical protein